MKHPLNNTPLIQYAQSKNRHDDITKSVRVTGEKINRENIEELKYDVLRRRFIDQNS